ncbi:LysM peptidoglycan-binding domain-containing protein [Amnibacterium endophyticum]|uniref:LysM peptidoglycan-binding domain-containing protein n=1 Tax=Amnibacterium endophyticum TaxID=2109337 RepID=A0ABW4LGS9_9MICO
MVSLMWSRRSGFRLWICAGVLVTLLTACTSVNSGPSPAPSSSAPTAASLPAFGDRGPEAYAHGRARLLDSGDYLYTVAKGDTAEGIARRFGSTPDRVSAGSRGGLEIFAGDVLRFGPAPGAPRTTSSPSD